jgi:hypothetical protein
LAKFRHVADPPLSVATTVNDRDPTQEAHDRRSPLCGPLPYGVAHSQRTLCMFA